MYIQEKTWCTHNYSSHPPEPWGLEEPRWPTRKCRDTRSGRRDIGKNAHQKNHSTFMPRSMFFFTLAKHFSSCLCWDEALTELFNNVSSAMERIPQCLLCLCSSQVLNKIGRVDLCGSCILLKSISGSSWYCMKCKLQILTSCYYQKSKSFDLLCYFWEPDAPLAILWSVICVSLPLHSWQE